LSKSLLLRKLRCLEEQKWQSESIFFILTLCKCQNNPIHFFDFLSVFQHFQAEDCLKLSVLWFFSIIKVYSFLFQLFSLAKRKEIVQCRRKLRKLSAKSIRSICLFKSFGHAGVCVCVCSCRQTLSFYFNLILWPIFPNCISKTCK